LGIRQRVSTHEDPRRFGKPLTGNKAALSRYRVVDHRVISRVEANDLPMLVVALGHRKLGF
jgi:mRNA interferase RelE/StbE